MTAPVAYIRRSVSRENDRGDVSREFQTDKVRALANGDRDALRIIDQDWGRSGGRKAAHLRAGMLALLADIEAGRVSTLYAYAEDRLARDVEIAVRLLNACERAGVTIVCSADRYPPGDARARRRFIDEANDNEYALSKMSEKSSDTATKRKDRGDRMGRAPYGYRHVMLDGRSVLVPREGEDPQHVVDAFLAAGSYLGAADDLNAEEYPTRFGTADVPVKWGPSTVRHVVLRFDREHGTGNAPVRTRRGAWSRSSRLFGSLLQCPHHKRHPKTPWLTSSPTKWGVRYYCRVAHTDPKHRALGPYIVSERKIVDWAKTEAAKLPGRLEVELKGKEPSVTATLDALTKRRERIVEAFLDGDIDRETKTRRIAEIEAEMPALEQGSRVLYSFAESGKLPRNRPAIDWDADIATVNAALRNLWQRIELNPATMEPVRAVWTIGQSPAEREINTAEDAEGAAEMEGRS